MYDLLIAAGKVERAMGLEIGPDEAFFLVVEDGVSDEEMGIPPDREGEPRAGPSRLQILLLARRGSRVADVLAAAAERGRAVVVEARLLPPLLAEDGCFFAAIPEQARVMWSVNSILTKWR